WAAASGDGRRGRAASSALQTGGQRVVAAGPDGSGFYRSGFDGLQPGGAGRSPKTVSRDSAGHRVGGRFHPLVCDAKQAVDFAEISGWRKLRNDAGGGTFRISAAA